ncbi:MAG: type II toxin-antitoxin system HicA family toxin [Nitrospinota bacterium]
MAGLHNLKPDKVVKAFKRAGWTSEGQKGSHVKLSKEGGNN